MHPIPNMLTVPESVLHERNVVASEEVQVVVARVGKPIQWLETSPQVSLVPDRGSKGIGVTDEHLVGGPSRFVFAPRLLYCYRKELLRGPAVHLPALHLPYPILAAIFRHPGRLEVLG